MSHSSITPAILTALLVLGAPLGAADEHAGHNHAAEDAHAHGPAVAIDSVNIGGHTIAVSASGAIAAGKAGNAGNAGNAGKEWHIELHLTPEQPAPKAIRVWVGAENGRGSVKAKAEAKKDATGQYGAHIEVPNPLPAGSALWISLEPDHGQATKGSVALPKAEPGHHNDEGHKH